MQMASSFKCLLVLYFLLLSLYFTQISRAGDIVEEGILYIDGVSSIAKIDKDFICATLDWWPPTKCDYGTCSWGNASLLNLVSFPLHNFSGTQRKNRKRTFL